MIASRRRAIARLTLGLAAAAMPGCRSAPASGTHTRAGLRTLEAGTGELPFVLLHGYGSSADEWIPFTATIRLPPDRRFVIPEGTETTTPPDGPADGRAWWRLGLDEHRRPGDGLPDLASLQPPGLVASTRRVRAVLDDLARSGRYPRQRQMLAGFSQGAMIAADIAFTTDEPLEALVLLSPTLVNESAWRRGMPARRGLRVFVAHGRRDTVLPFDVAMRLQQVLRDAGLEVTWFPFDGGHEVPAEVVTALNAFLAHG